MRGRSQLFWIGLLIMFILFSLRLVQLQIFQGKYFSGLAAENAARVTPILAPRGIIFDRYGKVLLKNRPVFAVYILPHLLPLDRAEQEKVFRRLSNILGKPVYNIKRKLKEKKSPLFEGLLIDYEISPSALTRIEEERKFLQGVEVICYPMRSYPYRSALAHVLGYIGEIEPKELEKMRAQGYRIGDLIGKDGVEKTYDRYLRGISGGKKMEVDAQGRPLKVKETLEPQPGNNMWLTIDLDLQLEVDKYLGNNEGAVVVMDPRSGEILALVSHPAYDPSLKWQEISQNKYPFMNRALATYPPGSIFKFITLTAALESKIVDLKEDFRCNGWYKLGIRWAKCWLKRGHGVVKVLEGLVWSCDVVFYELGKRLGPDVIHKYAEGYGLNQKTGIDLPQEKKGLVPTAAWKKKEFGEEWVGGDSINIGIGQGFLKVTPLQMAVALGTLAVGKRMTPYVVEKVENKQGEIIYKGEPQEKGKLPLSLENSKLIRDALAEVVLRGTGVAAYNRGIPACGKTGTAENPGKAHAWFICYAPKDDPEIVIASFVAHGEHGDKISAYIARDILNWYEKNRLKREIMGPPRPKQYIVHGHRHDPYLGNPEE